MPNPTFERDGAKARRPSTSRWADGSSFFDKRLGEFMHKLSLVVALISAFPLHSVFAEDTSIVSSKTSVGHTESYNKEKQIVERVVLAYVCIDEDVLCEKGVFKGHVQVIKIFGKYAKVQVFPDANVDPEWVYLKKGKTGWDVLDSGTGVNPMELGIPKEAW